MLINASNTAHSHTAHSHTAHSHTAHSHTAKLCRWPSTVLIKAVILAIMFVFVVFSSNAMAERELIITNNERDQVLIVTEQKSPFINPGPVVKQIEQIGGLSLNGVRQMVQGKFGFIWLATYQGLLRFDGYSIKRFVNDDNNEARDDIKAMVVDPQGDIWLATDDGLGRFSVKTERLDYFLHIDGDNTTIDNNRLNVIALAADNSLWIGSRSGINAFDRQTLTNLRLNATFGIAEPVSIQLLVEDIQQRLWFVADENGLNMQHLGSGQRQHFFHQANDSGSLSSNIVNTLYQRGDGTIWVGTSVGVDRFEPSNARFERFSIPIIPANKRAVINVTKLFEDKTGRLWIASHDNGLSVLHPGATGVVSINDGLGGKNSFNAIAVHQGFQDNSGILWFATGNNGIVRFSPHALLAEHQLIPLDVPLEITTVYSDNVGGVWLGTTKHLYGLNVISQRFELVARNTGYISSISQGHDQRLILAVRGQGIFSFNSQTGQVNPLGGQPLSLQPKQLIDTEKTVAVDSQGIVWLGMRTPGGGTAGLFSYDPSNQRYTQHHNAISVTAILPVSGQNGEAGEKIIVGTNHNGLKILDKASGVWTDIRDASHNLSQIRALYQDSQQRVWVGNKSIGLAQLDIVNGRLQYFFDELRFPDNIVVSIVEDKSGALWLGSMEGVIKFDPQTRQISRFDKRQGLRLEFLGKDKAGITPSGQIIMANDDGLMLFFPDKLSATSVTTEADLSVSVSLPVSLPVLLSDFRLFDQPVAVNAQRADATSLNHTSELTLTHTQYRFSFSFASSDYRSPLSTRYAYKMAEANDPQAQWVNTDGHNRLAAFTSLQAGDYVFTVKASNPDGSWNESSTRRLNIHIKPPIWATTTAYVLYVLMAAFLGFMYNSIRVRQLQKRAEVLQKGIEKRTIALQQRADTIAGLLADKDRLFANISHEFRTPLTLILGPLESGLNRVGDDKLRSLLNLAIGNAQRLLGMVDQLLDISRLQNTPQQDHQVQNVLTTCQFLIDSYHSLADSQNIRLQIEHQLQQDVYVDMQPDALEKILSNLLTNAFKYSDGQQVITLSLALKNENKGDKVVISINDTGMGIGQADQQHIFERFTRVENHSEYVPGAGIGLALVKELVEQHNGSISVQSELTVGSTFTCILPLSEHKAEHKPKHQPEREFEDEAPSGQVNKALMQAAVEQIKLHQLPIESESLSAVETGVYASIGIGADTSRPNILVIEDNAEMRQYIVSCLDALFVCTVAVDGEQGVEVARETLPDLIVSDVMMPKMDGFAVTKTLKTDPSTNHIPIILLTADGGRQSRLKGWDEKVDEYLEKPFNTTELQMRIENLLAIRGILRQRYQREFASAMPVAGEKTIVAEKPLNGEVPTKIEAEDESVNQVHQIFFDKINQVLEQHYADENFNLEVFSQAMNMSGRQLGRKMKALLDLSPVESIRHYRLKKAAELLSQGISPSAVFHEVGFTSHSYFSRCFKAQYQQMPSSFAENRR